MSISISIEEAQTRLKELITALIPGEVIIITDGLKPIARLSGAAEVKHQPRKPGNCKGLIEMDIEDEDHLQDFGEYMP